MIIEMLMAREGSPDGKTVIRYETGHRYRVPGDISRDLARVFIENQWAAELPDGGKKDGRKKDLGSAPENKKKSPRIPRLNFKL